MARYSTTVSSYATQLAGANSTTTVNGYIGYWGASATSGFRLRRVGVHLMGSGVPVSQQFSVGVYRQTAAPSGTGLASAILGQALEIWTPQTDPTVGLITTTGPTIGTTGPTVATNPLFTLGMNSQSFQDAPWEGYEEIICNLGTANGIAFVNIGNTLPTGTQIKLSVEIEV